MSSNKALTEMACFLYLSYFKYVNIGINISLFHKVHFIYIVCIFLSFIIYNIYELIIYLTVGELRNVKNVLLENNLMGSNKKVYDINGVK